MHVYRQYRIAALKPFGILSDIGTWTITRNELCSRRNVRGGVGNDNGDGITDVIQLYHHHDESKSIEWLFIQRWRCILKGALRSAELFKRKV